MRGLMQQVTRRWGLVLALGLWYVAMILLAAMNLPLPLFLPSQFAVYLVLALAYSMIVQFLWKRHERAGR